MKGDFYGDKFKFFIGVVKDVSDPLNSNRVRVRIKGIHPEDPMGDGGGTGGGFSDGTGSSGSSSSTTSTQTSPLAAIPVDRSSLPNGFNLGAKISNHWTLGQLTTQTVFGARCGQYLNNLTPEIVYNLSNLARNCLDPLKEQFGSLIITSGWRPHGSAGSSTSNHGNGWAADLQAPGKAGYQGVDAIFSYARDNLKGRYTFLYHEANHIHIQLGGPQGTLTNPLIKVK